MANPSKKLRVNLEEIEFALTDHSGAEYHLDLETGRVIFVPSYDESMMDPDEREALALYPDRFIFIEALPSAYEWNLMDEFASGLEEGEAKMRLRRALSGRHPFRAFKDALLDYPALREAWFQVRNTSLRATALAWLEENGICSEL